ncbi:hypothetical protein ACFV19_14450 [Streptomyces griseoluteus]|uniref:hypothetical protein n=1 Tax=Streptomyces griseoluteus TaxID=29306 RepID=UPI00369B485E
MVIKKIFVVVGVLGAMGAALLTATPAVAAGDDFEAWTTDGGCGYVDFIDYGPGAPGGGDNDDYLVIHDRCADGHGVEAYAWLDGAYLGKHYDGNGLDGAAVVWDPFGNVQDHQTVGIKVCLVDGPDDPSPSYCDSRQAEIHE